MAGNILTPITLWGEFKTDKIPTMTEKDVTVDGDLRITRCYIDGRDVDGQSVKIFAVITEKGRLVKKPAVLLLRDFSDEQDKVLIKDLAERGYIVVDVDLAGKVEGKECYTEYPESIDYANYEKVKDNLYTVENDVSQTCWYEWGCVAKYVLAYLKEQSRITMVGGIGIAEAATVLWQVAGTDKNLCCAAFVMNSGWSGYRGIHKYGGQVEPQFSDNMYKFIAGIDPQTYAMHIDCPVLMLTPTNSSIYDCDRAFDTLSKIKKDVYKALHYSVGYSERISGKGYNNLVIFFDKILKHDSISELPQEADIKAELDNGEIVVEVTPDMNNVKRASLYVSEETTVPAERCWFKLSDGEKLEDKFVFRYRPYKHSRLVTFFSHVKYKNNFTIGTKIIAKKFKSEEVGGIYKSNIVYSSRTDDGESIFTAANQKMINSDRINVSDDKRIKVLTGPMDIEGVYCPWGLLTYKINALKDKPNPDAMFMFDVYSKEGCVVTVKLISDYHGEKTEYMANITVCGGEIWHNIKLEKSKFKTAEGMSLKSYDKVNAIEFDAQGEWLINNALWV